MSDRPLSDHGDAAHRSVSFGPGLPGIPEHLLLAHARGEVLFICGAGVSRSAGLPDFRELVRDVYGKLDRSVYNILTKIPRTDPSKEGPDCSELEDDQAAEVRRFVAGDYDVVLGMLERRLDREPHGESKVRGTVAEVLRMAGDKPARIHWACMRLADRGTATTIMTTNFDLLLEAAAKRLRSPVQTYALGSIPRPTTRKEFAGVLHIHGALDPNPVRTSDLVLSDQDFGEYYLRRRIVPDLIYDAARLFHLVLVGYSANDPPMRYLLNAVAADGSRFSDLKERFTFVGSEEIDPVELEDWRTRGITPIHYSAPRGDHSILRDTLDRWADLSAINGKPKAVDAEVRRIVRKNRTAAPQADRELFDHLFRRGHGNERIRLAGLASVAKAEPGWLDSIIDTISKKAPTTAAVTRSWAGLNEMDRYHVQIMTAFLKNRLAEPAVIDWALRRGSDWNATRIALDQMLNDHGSPTVAEPYATSWRLIEESLRDRPVRDHPAMVFVGVRDRLSKGDRSGALVSAIVDLFAPRLEVKRIEERPWWPFERPRHPKTFKDVLSADVTSVRLGNLSDYGDLHIDKVSDVVFLTELANALASAVQRGLDIANRIYATDQGRGVPPEDPERVYFVRPAGDGSSFGTEFGDGSDEPDLFNAGIAPSVKLLHEVVLRIADLDLRAATPFLQNWRHSVSHVHRRLWAAAARNAQLATTREVGDFLATLSDHEIWDLENFPEITELMARRIRELPQDVQKGFVQRLYKGPPRKLYARAAPAEKARREYCAAREVKRVEVAGGIIPPTTHRWLLAQVKRFPDLRDMSLDGGFFDTRVYPAPRTTPNTPYENLHGEARLRALNDELAHDGVHWIDSAAKDWLQRDVNAPLILSDLESFTGAGEEFPRVWNCFLWSHSPPPPKPHDELLPQPQDEANRLLRLLTNLQETTLAEVIWGVSHWLFSWRRCVIRSKHCLSVWSRAWPFAVEKTNTIAEDTGDIRSGQSDDRQEPPDIDTFNSPTGRLIEVFMTGCQSLSDDTGFVDDGGPGRQMRDCIISASGHSGLIARCRLAERLQFFLRKDPAWAKQYLVDPLLANDFQSIALWRVVAKRSSKALLGLISDLDVLAAKAIERATDLHLGQSARESLVGCLVIEVLTAFRDRREPVVAEARISQMLRSGDSETRLFAVGAVGSFQEGLGLEGQKQSAENLFHTAIVPFFQRVWPQEQDLTSPDVSRELSSLPTAAGEAFAEAVAEIERFLVPFDCWSMVDYGLYGEVETGSEVIPKLQRIIDNDLKALAFFKLLTLTIGATYESMVPYDLSDALDRIGTLAPDLVNSPEFRRLSAAARRRDKT